MSRYTGPRARINRRFGQKIFNPCKAEEKKPYIPGMHGPHLRRKVSDYSLGLTEKQKLRFMFGLSEKQFKLTFMRAKNLRGVTGSLFLRLLELRLDSVVYNLGLAKSRSAARQFVNHGHIRVNGRKVDIPSYVCAAGDIVEIADRTSSKQLALANTELTRYRNVPAWLDFNSTMLKGTVARLPEREEMDIQINEQLIVEFYSR